MKSIIYSDVATFFSVGLFFVGVSAFVASVSTACGLPVGSSSWEDWLLVGACSMSVVSSLLHARSFR